MAGAVMLTLGAMLAFSATVIAIGAETVTAPRLSVALAVRENAPTGRLVQEKL